MNDPTSVSTSVTGAIVTGSSALVSLTSESIPILQISSLAVSLLVGVLTAIYTAQKILDRRDVRIARQKAHDEIAQKLITADRAVSALIAANETKTS